MDASFGTTSLAMQSATKYLNGHSDVTGGVVCGPRRLVAPIETTRRLLGTVMDPLPAYARRSAEEIDAAIAAERSAWD